jgi:hypothetical protein
MFARTRARVYEGEEEEERVGRTARNLRKLEFFLASLILVSTAVG